MYAENMEILVDACAIMAFIADEPEGPTVLRLTRGATIVSPHVLPFEIANALTKMMKKKIIDNKDKMLQIYQQFKRVYAYDAFYLEPAKRLNLPLLTFDGNMNRVGALMGLTMLGGKNAGI
jgi:predicted nucleic acid-binding protein